MAKKYKSKWNIERLTNTDIYDAIRDLEPNPKRATELDDNAVFMIFMSLLILLLGCLGFLWLHP